MLLLLPVLLLPVYVCAGDMYEIGAEKGKYYSVNVPLRDGIDDQSKSCDPYKTNTLSARK